MRPSHAFVLLCACTSSNASPDTATGDDAAPAIDAPADAPPGGTHATGAVTAVQYQATCTIPNAIGAGQPGFRCAVLTVSCPGLDDAQVDVALVPAAASKGVIATHSGSNGTTFQNDPLVLPWLQFGFSLAQIAWHAPWECPKHAGAMCAADTTPLAQRASMVDAGCRPATVMQWIHDTAQRADGSPFVATGAAFCGHGSSGGSGAFWYALMQYGLANRLDFVLLGASTPFGRIDIGCDPQNATMTVPGPCDNVAPPQVWVYDDANGAGSSRAFNTWLSTTGCGVAPTADEMALYARSSVLAAGADLAFPTPVSTYDCVDAQTLNVVPGGGHFVHDALRANDPAGAKWKGTCVVTTPQNRSCTQEAVFEDTNARTAAIAEMEARCVPLQR